MKSSKKVQAAVHTLPLNLLVEAGFKILHFSGWEPRNKSFKQVNLLR
jgi:hypothetical protein